MMTLRRYDSHDLILEVPMSASSWYVLGWTGPMMAIHPPPPRPYQGVGEGHPDLAEARGKHGDWKVEAGPFSDKAAAERDAASRRSAESARA